MSEPQVMIISCIPVRDLINLAYAQKLLKPGVKADELPWLKPYAGSVEARCPVHGGKMWIGPAQQQRISAMEARGEKPLIACHLCTLSWAKNQDADITLMQLSNEETEMFWG